MADLTKYAKGKRMVREDKIKKLEALNQVEANPTLEGEEETLESLKIGNKKYALGGGTEVIANPELAGTETPLIGLQVRETKYTVGGEQPHLYEHRLSFQITTSNYTYGSFKITILTNSSQAFDYNGFRDYCNSQTIFINFNICKVVINSANETFIFETFTIRNNTGFSTSGHKVGDSGAYVYDEFQYTSIKSTGFSDTVIQIF